jgi:hypothetical protein
MTYASSREARSPIFLRDGSSRDDVARACREAALAFMEGVRGGWDKVDVALWLTGPYARATRHVPRGERAVLAAAADEVAPAAIEELLVRTRVELLAALENAALSRGVHEFAEETIARGHVRRAVDADGHDAWVPADAARLRLRDRLRALFAADYLTAPGGYLELVVCHYCESVVFDRDARRTGVCSRHRLSGFYPREDAAVDRNLPRGSCVSSASGDPRERRR